MTQEEAVAALVLSLSVKKALSRKFRDVPLEEIHDAAMEGFAVYLEKDGRDESGMPISNPSGYIWRVALRCVCKYLKHNNREALMGDHEYDLDAHEMFELNLELDGTLTEILTRLKNGNYREMLELHGLKELEFEEIAIMQDRQVKTLQRSWERAIIAARKIAENLELCPPPQNKCQTSKK